MNINECDLLINEFKSKLILFVWVPEVNKRIKYFNENTKLLLTLNDDQKSINVIHTWLGQNLLIGKIDQISEEYLIPIMKTYKIDIISKVIQNTFHNSLNDFMYEKSGTGIIIKIIGNTNIIHNKYYCEYCKKPFNTLKEYKKHRELYVYNDKLTDKDLNHYIKDKKIEQKIVDNTEELIKILKTENKYGSSLYENPQLIITNRSDLEWLRHNDYISSNHNPLKTEILLAMFSKCNHYIIIDLHNFNKNNVNIINNFGYIICGEYGTNKSILFSIKNFKKPPIEIHLHKCNFCDYTESKYITEFHAFNKHYEKLRSVNWEDKDDYLRNLYKVDKGWIKYPLDNPTVSSDSQATDTSSKTMETAMTETKSPFNMDKIMNRFFRKVDGVVWDLMTGKLGIQTDDGIRTVEGEGEDAQIQVNLMDQFGMAIPAFAQNTPSASVAVGDIIYGNKDMLGWVIAVPTEGRKSFKIMKKDGSRSTWTPPKISTIGFALDGVLVLKSLGSMFGDNTGGLANMQNMMLPMMMMGGDDIDMEKMVMMMLFSNTNGGAAANPMAAMMPMMMMGMMKGKMPFGK